MNPPSPLPPIQANPGCCEYWIGPRERCNAPAVCQRARTAFRYCAEHADQVQVGQRRHGKSLHLVPIKP